MELQIRPCSFCLERKPGVVIGREGREIHLTLQEANLLIAALSKAVVEAQA